MTGVKSLTAISIRCIILKSSEVIMKPRQAVFLFLLVVTFTALFTFNMGAPSLFEEDEARVTEVARETLLTGKWIDLQHNFEPWFHKPPLYPWLTALTFFFFGLSEFAARIWAAIFSLAAIVTTFFIGRVLYDEEAGGLAGTILGTSLIVVSLSRAGFVDSGLMFFVAFSMLMFMLYYKGENRPYYLHFSAAAMALGTLTKGPLGIMLPGASIFLYLLACSDLRFIEKNLKPILWAALTYFLIATPWWIGETVIHGKAFTHALFGMYMIGIYSTAFQKHSGPWYFYFFVILLGMIPWSIHLIYGLVHSFKKEERAAASILLIWAAVVLALFSSAQTKVPGYLLPIFPPLSIITARGILKLLKRETVNNRLAGYFTFGGNALMMMLFLIAAHVVKVNPEYVNFVLIFRMTFFLFLGLSAAALVFYCVKKLAPYSVLALALIGVVFVISASEYILPAFEYYKPSRRLVADVKAFLPKGEKVEYYIYKAWFRSSLVFYLRQKVNVLNIKPEFLALLKSGRKFVVFTDPDKFKKVFPGTPKGIRKIGREFDLEAYTNVGCR
jgi:4-amino-4-deoxy-L-arabinose transferase-like glycosyltransferase